MGTIRKMFRKSLKSEAESGQTFMGFTRELVVAFAMALVVIVYVIQAFKIPSSSMENSLYPNDFLLGLKFIYGAPVLPFSYMKFPGITSPKAGDVVIFKYPGPEKKDYIKRCVAGPGQTVEIRNKVLYVDGEKQAMPSEGKHEDSRIMPAGMDPRDHFSVLKVPRAGDTLFLNNMSLRDIYFAKGVIHQENPKANMHIDIQLYVDGVYKNNEYMFRHMFSQLRFADINFDVAEWHYVEGVISRIKAENPESEVEIKSFLYMDQQPLNEYVLRDDCYFMMGDNRDNSKDSRYWGFLNRNFVKAKAFILYFSYHQNASFFNPVTFIRWNRIGKLIH